MRDELRRREIEKQQGSIYVARVEDMLIRESELKVQVNG
jgi:hypothetical protein